MSVLCGLEVDGVDEVEFLDDDTGPQVEVGQDDLDKLVGALVAGTICLNEEGQRLRNTNGVRQLHERATSELSVNQRLCDPARKVRSRAIDLGVILS